MKRAILAITAVSATPVVAHAQSNVTLYGMITGGLTWQNNAQTAATAADGRPRGSARFAMLDAGSSGPGASRWGVTGTEDLGGGLKANFTLESGINLGTGEFNDSNGNLFGRQAWVGLGGRFGDVRLGLQFSPFFYALYDLDPRQSITGGSLLPWLNAIAGAGIFTRNAVSYTSPSFGGLQGSVLFAFGNVAGDFQAGKQVSASLAYRWRDLLVEAAYFDSNASPAPDTVPPTAVPFEGRMLGASYRIGNVTAKASFTSLRVSGGPSNSLYGGGLDIWRPRPSI